MNGIEESLHQYICAEFLPGESPDQLKEDTPLRTSGIIDSMRLLKMVAYVEETYGIELAAHETGIETFNSIRDIAALIRSKRK